ncbi:MAG: hypothetical protein WA159_24915 [Variovorax sp.]
MKKLSIIGKGYHTEEHALGFYTIGDRVKTWGGIGGFWGAIWGLLAGPAVFLIPAVGIVPLPGHSGSHWSLRSKAQWSWEACPPLPRPWWG